MWTCIIKMQKIYSFNSRIGGRKLKVNSNFAKKNSLEQKKILFFVHFFNDFVKTNRI